MLLRIPVLVAVAALAIVPASATPTGGFSFTPTASNLLVNAPSLDLATAVALGTGPNQITSKSGAFASGDDAITGTDVNFSSLAAEWHLGFPNYLVGYAPLMSWTASGNTTAHFDAMQMWVAQSASALHLTFWGVYYRDNAAGYTDAQANIDITGSGDDRLYSATFIMPPGSDAPTTPTPFSVPTPEPATMALVGAGLLAFGYVRRVKR